MKKGKKSKKFIMDLIMMSVLVIGVGALLYPLVSDSLNNFVDQQIINYYQKKANNENAQVVAKEQAAMEQKNKELAKNGNNPGADPFSEKVKKKKIPVKPQKSYFEEHTLGIIEIPKIKIKLPIFDQTNDLFLSKGTSLLEGTSFPTGGVNTHAVISGHRGLPEAKLFTDLPELKIGDKFYIHINKQIHAYQVDQKKVIEPTNTDDLHIVPGQDYVTLMTCTPYMINSHRLLVRGHRVPYIPEKDDKVLKGNDNDRLLRQIAIIGGSILILLLMLYGFYRWLKALRISRRQYPLKLTLKDAKGSAIADEPLALYTKNGKHALTRDGQPLRTVTNEEGSATFDQLKGGRYLVKTAENEKVKIFIRKVKDTEFSLKTKKKAPLRVLPKTTIVERKQ